MRYSIVVFIVAILFLVITVAYGAHKTSEMQLVSMAFAFLFIIFSICNFFYMFIQIKQQGWLSLLPVSICVCAIVVSWNLIQPVRDVIESWTLPQYEKIVEDIQSGKIPIPPGEDNLIPPKSCSAPLAGDVFAAKDEKQNLVVEFVTESGFPALHSGYMYSGSDEVSEAIHRWPIQYKVKKNWFFVSK